MTDLNPPREKTGFKVVVMLSVLALVFLYAFVVEMSPGPSGSLVPDAVRSAQADPSKETVAPAKQAKEPPRHVIVYVTSWCPACRMTMDYLKKKDIPFTVKDIEKNDEYMREMIQKVGAYRGVPVLDINGRIMLGFNPQVLDQLAK
jgi:glutaredoxin 3